MISLIFLSLTLNFEALFNKCEFDSILKLYPKSVYDSVLYMRSAALLEKWDDLKPIVDSLPADSANPSYLPYVLQYLMNSPYNGKGSLFFRRAMELYNGVEDYLTYMWGLYFLENNQIDSATRLLFKLHPQNMLLFKNLAREIVSRLMQYREYEKYLTLRRKLYLRGGYFQYAYILSLKGTGNPYRSLIYAFFKKYPKSSYSIALLKFLKKKEPAFIPALYHGKKYKDVIKIFERYKPQGEKSLILYLKSLYKTRNYKKLTKNIKKYRKRLADADDVELFLMMGLAFLRLGKTDKALGMFFDGCKTDDPRIITEFFYTLFKNRDKEDKWKKVLLSYRESFDGFLLNFYAGIYFLSRTDTQNAWFFLQRARLLASQETDVIKATYYLSKINDTIRIQDSLFLTYYNLREGAIKIDGKTDLMILLNNNYADYPLPQSKELFRWKVLFMLGGYRVVRKEIDNNPRSMVLAAKMAQKEGLIGEGIYYAIRLLPFIRTISDTSGFPVEFLKLYFPLTYLSKVSRYSEMFGFDPLLFMALMREESWFDNRAISPVGALGLCQLMPYTARKLAGDSLNVSTTSLFNPDINIRLGSYYFTALMDTLGSVPLALSGYNAGPFRVKKWFTILNRYVDDLDIFIEFIPITETRRYVKRILRTRRIYGKLITMGAKP